MVASWALLMSAMNSTFAAKHDIVKSGGVDRCRYLPCNAAVAEQAPRHRTQKVNGRGGLTLGVLIAVVFGQNLFILLSQLQPLLNNVGVTRPVCPGGPSPFQGS